MNFRTSTYCHHTATCVEVADGIAIRDKADPDGPVLQVSPDAWMRFITAIR
jgi:hypothetical protein